MPEINKLCRVDEVSAGDLVPVFATNNGDARAAAMSVLLAYFQSQLTSGGSFITKYSSPNATDFSVSIAPSTNGANVYLLLTPTGAFAAGEIVLPALANCVDGQEVMVSCTQDVTALTVGGNGAVVNGAPASLSANDFFKLRFDAINSSWYRIG